MSDLTLKNEFNYLLLQTSQENQLFLIDKINGTIEQNFRDAHLIPVFRENQQLSDVSRSKPFNSSIRLSFLKFQFLAIFDDHNQHLWLINATDRVKTDVSFKPKQIHIVSSDNEFFVVETSNQVGVRNFSRDKLDLYFFHGYFVFQLFISSTSVLDWKTIDDSSSSIILGWFVNSLLQ